MAILLAASTAVAWWMSDAKGPDRLAASEIGAFRFAGPVGWESQAQSFDGPGLTASVRVMLEAGERGRVLSVAELQYGRAVSPNAALGLIMQQMVRGLAQLLDTSPLRIGPMVGVRGRAYVMGDDQQMGAADIAVLTLDGKRYFGLSLISPSMSDAGDAVMVEQMLRSVLDRRFELMGNGIDIGDRTHLTLPAGLTAGRLLGRGTTDVSLLVSPTQRPEFFYVALRMMDTRAAVERLAQVSSQSTALPPALADLIAKAAAQPNDPRSRFGALLAFMYWQARHELPARLSITASQVEGRPVLGMMLNDVRPNVVYQVLEAVPLDDTRALIMELVAEPTAAAQVQAEARAVISGLELSTAPAGAADESHETPTAPDAPDSPTHPEVPGARRTAP
ncbi:MAG: hypothetical protein GC162_10680 [Planctomycetes bacterium]|nr:hypothetical protein [Planctomycetota bacterium]